MKPNPNEWLAARRKELKISQDDVVNICGVSRQTVSMWEHGVTFPRKRHIPILAALLKLPVREVASRLSSARSAKVYWEFRDLADDVGAA